MFTAIINDYANPQIHNPAVRESSERGSKCIIKLLLSFATMHVGGLASIGIGN